MKKMFFYALTGAFMSVAASASAQSTVPVQNLAAPTARQAATLSTAPRQANDGRTRISATSQAQGAATAQTTTTAQTATTSHSAKTSTTSRAKLNNKQTGAASSADAKATTAPATKTK